MLAESLYISIFNLNTGICRPDKNRILVYLTQWWLHFSVELQPLGQTIYTIGTLLQFRILVFYVLVEGGLSPWSLWTPCTAYCGSGTRTRKRMCTLQKPRCGGNKCDPTAKLSEEESCEGACKGKRPIWLDVNHLMMH